MHSDALWRSPTDSWYGQGGEPVEVLERYDDGAEVRYRLRFEDGEVMTAPAEEVSFDLDPPLPVSLTAAQSSLDLAG